jgi:hypothetical protein
MVTVRLIMLHTPDFAGRAGQRIRPETTLHGNA